jgi:acetyltransferase-like isoleucine patch superfamily enzyme
MLVDASRLNPHAEPKDPAPMPEYKYRDLRPTPEGEEVFRRWLRFLNDELTRHKDPKLRNELVRDTLHQLLFARPHGGKLNFQLTTELPFNCVELSLDPANVTLEPEYYGDIDEEKYAERKPLIWLWQMFDRSPLALNHWLGFRFRCVLGQHIFKSIGKNVKIFHGVEFSFGYNLTIEDDCTIHKFVMLDDRGEIILRRGTSISDYASVYSHAHHAKNSLDIQNRTVEIGPRARVTYHASVMAGVNVREDAILGAMAVATRDVEPGSIAGGIPAKEIKKKSDLPGEGWDDGDGDDSGKNSGKQRAKTANPGANGKSS